MAEICVTGASGFIASWLIKRLLENGYFVRGTVRDPDNFFKISHLLQLPYANERLKLYKAELLTDGDFDSVVEGCEGVFHVAANVTMSAKDGQAEIVDPCVAGTQNVLNACKKSTTVKRVVITSSASAVCARDDFTPDQILDDSSWSSVEFCQETKAWYPLGKTLSEKAALEFGQSSGIDVVSVAPSFVVGPLLSSTPSASSADLVTLLNGSTASFPVEFTGYVHLDDVASAHILVYENPNAEGRYLCAAENRTNNELAEFLSQRYPQYKIPTKFDTQPYFKGFTSSKLKSLGFQFKSLEEMFDDAVESLEAKGLVGSSRSKQLELESSII